MDTNIASSIEARKELHDKMRAEFGGENFDFLVACDDLATGRTSGMSKDQQTDMLDIIARTYIDPRGACSLNLPGDEREGFLAEWTALQNKNIADRNYVPLLAKLDVVTDTIRASVNKENYKRLAESKSALAKQKQVTPAPLERRPTVARLRDALLARKDSDQSSGTSRVTVAHWPMRFVSEDTALRLSQDRFLAGCSRFLQTRNLEARQQIYRAEVHPIPDDIDNPLALEIVVLAHSGNFGPEMGDLILRLQGKLEHSLGISRSASGTHGDDVSKTPFDTGRLRHDSKVKHNPDAPKEGLAEVLKLAGEIETDSDDDTSHHASPAKGASKNGDFD